MIVTTDVLAVLVVPVCFVVAGVLGLRLGTPGSIAGALVGVGATHLLAFATSAASLDVPGRSGALLHVLSQSLFGLGFVSLLWIALMFPHGARPGRWVGLAAGAAVILPAVGGLSGATPAVLGEGVLRGPVAPLLPEALTLVAAGPLAGVPLLTVGVFLVRLVRSRGDARRAMLWPVTGVAAVAALAVLGIVLGDHFPGAASAAFLVAAPVVPLAVAFGPVRRRLLHLHDQTSRLSADLAARIAELEESRQRLSVAAEEERRRIERDLHDGAQQELLALLSFVEVARKSDEPVRRDAALARVADLAGSAYTTVRAVSHGVRPAVLDDLGLAAAVQATVSGFPLPVRHRVHGDRARRFAPAVEGAALFVVLEALANVLRHAQAGSVAVELDLREGLVVTVEDDGCGGVDASGSGVCGLRDRVESVGGRLDLQSRPGATRVCARFAPEDP